MSDEKMPTTLEEARALGYERIESLETFLRDNLDITVDEFNARHHRFSKSIDNVDCTRDPENTPCVRSCDPKTHIGIFGVCGPNGTCDLYQGRC
ncbi:hypothetical protein [Sphingomonas sp. Leaf4]|uniref:hypothetical protein n=1 Tax=Sphingomonas sp. Leaf4 TaxID=2876553 RepID=UPI001E5B0F30|nr:hypothetical protein [Sphingomonas sp. Leaf4]